MVWLTIVAHMARLPDFSREPTAKIDHGVDLVSADDLAIRWGSRLLLRRLGGLRRRRRFRRLGRRLFLRVSHCCNSARQNGAKGKGASTGTMAPACDPPRLWKDFV